MPRDLPEGWDWSEAGYRAWDEEIDNFDAALWNLWIAKTRFRNSRTLDVPELREAGRMLLVTRIEPWWKLPMRIFITVVAICGGLAIKQAVDNGLNTSIFLALMGTIVVVMAVAANETVLRR